jgi:hypothetical protein
VHIKTHSQADVSLHQAHSGAPKESLGAPKRALGAPKRALGAPKGSLGSPKGSLGAPMKRFSVAACVLSGLCVGVLGCEPTPLPLGELKGGQVGEGAVEMGAVEMGAVEMGAVEMGAVEAGVSAVEAGVTAAGGTQALDELRGDELTGLWLAEHITTTVMTLPALNEEVTTTATSLLSLHVRQEGGSLRVSSQTCAVEMLSEPNIGQRILPEPFLNALALQERAGEVWREEGELHFELPPFYELRGVTLTDPINEALPTSADDPRVIDADRDGHPGLTVTLTGFPAGDVYLVQRSWDAWRGVEVERDEAGRVMRLKAALEWGEEQSRLAATNEVLLLDIPQRTLSGTDEAGRFYQRVELRRVEAEEAGCP